MEAKGLFFIFLGVFILLTIATFVITPGVEVDTGLGSRGRCEEGCRNDDICAERCKTALVNQASAAGEVNGCDELVNTDEKDECVERLKLNLALKSQDSGLCAGLKSESDCRDTILYNKAISSGDKSLCSGIIDENTKSICAAY